MSALDQVRKDLLSVKSGKSNEFNKWCKKERLSFHDDEPGPSTVLLHAALLFTVQTDCSVNLLTLRNRCGGGSRRLKTVMTRYRVSNASLQH